MNDSSGQNPPRPRVHRLLAGCVAACLSATIGCYDGDVLVGRVRNDALRHRLEEVDLGRYDITMPRDPFAIETVEIEMHLYGSLPRYRQAEVAEMLEQRSHRLRHDTLIAVRSSSPEDFTDPDLSDLRQRLLAVTNSLLEEPSIQSIGFHQIRFIRQ